MTGVSDYYRNFALIMIPPFQTYLLPFLQYVSDGKQHRILDVAEALGKSMGLTQKDLEEVIESSGKPRHYYRCSWAKTYLSKAGLIQFPERAVFVITDKGRELLASGVTKLSQRFLIEHYPSFAEFAKKKNKSTSDNDSSIEECTTPQERMEKAYQELTQNTMEELLCAIKEQSPTFFEKLVVELLVKMGYGGDFEDAAKVTQPSCDGGIDGIIKEDALGLDKIYIQAKRWADKVVSAPDIQQFIGALINVGATKGIYITTSRFSDSARRAAQTGQLKIVLIDGELLTRYMIKHGLGVITERSFEVKRVDIGYFHNDE